MAVNSAAWKRFPVADRDQSFNADEAIARIRDHSKGNVAAFGSAFLWRSSTGAANNVDSYRLPVVDVLNGKMTLIPHAVFTAAAILSGAHGGLEGVLDEKEKKQLKGVVTEIYAMLQKAYGDPRVKPPWLRGGNKEEDVTASLVAAVNSGGWPSMPMAPATHPWSAAQARNRVWEWADGDFRKYRKAFLWHDTNDAELKASYKLPIADVIDDQLHIVPRAVNAVAQVLAGARGGVDIPDNDMDAVEAVVQRIQKRFEAGSQTASGVQDDETIVAAGAPLAPPAHWFSDPHFHGPTPLVVTADGQVKGHLAAWGVCHAGIANQCVMAPHSAAGYKYFLNGTVLTADGSLINVGKITLGTGHADTRLGWIPAADHYDNTGTVAAIVAAGEDRYGIWVAGALAPDADLAQAAVLRRSPLSGDWRRINGNLELVAALAVNTPGFPIVNLNASGEPLALCAAGVVLDDGTIMAAGEPEPTPEPDIRAVERLAALEQEVQRLGVARRKARMQRLLS
jgi:hypothetical protein